MTQANWSTYAGQFNNNGKEKQRSLCICRRIQVLLWCYNAVCVPHSCQLFIFTIMLYCLQTHERFVAHFVAHFVAPCQHFLFGFLCLSFLRVRVRLTMLCWFGQGFCLLQHTQPWRASYFHKILLFVHLMLSSYSPVVSAEIMNASFEPQNVMAKYDPRHGKYWLVVRCTSFLRMWMLLLLPSRPSAPFILLTGPLLVSSVVSTINLRG